MQICSTKTQTELIQKFFTATMFELMNAIFKAGFERMHAGEKSLVVPIDFVCLKGVDTSGVRAS